MRPSQPLSVQVSKEGSALIAKLSGSVDGLEAAALREHVEALVAQNPDRIVLDMKGLDFIGSTGLSAIVAAYRASRYRKGLILLAAPSPSIRDVFRRTRLDSLFPVFGSVREALSQPISAAG